MTDTVTVKETIEAIDEKIDQMKLNGLSTVVVISILEMMLDVLRTLAVHTVAARIR